MYARELMIWLHERLGEQGGFEHTQKRFESLRGYNLLPRGRENANVRMSNEQIANAVLGFAHPMPGFAGHASLILGDLRPVGGPKGCFENASDLKRVVAALIETEQYHCDLSRLTLSVERDFSSDNYAATLCFRDAGKGTTVSFVSKNALSLFRLGAEEDYDHIRLDKLTAIQRSLGPRFFKSLSRDVSISRQLDRPLKTDWREYETEEEKAEFYKRLGARNSSQFLNLRVDAQVTWPKEPTRIEFGGHQLVLFPKTRDHSHSVSIDLTNERISEDAAVSLINRMLSVMSWCDDQPASLHEGWSGNPVPVPVPRQNLALMTMHDWHFYRDLPTNVELLRCLAYYRDGLNARSVGLASHAFLSFYRVCETRYHTKALMIPWINSAVSAVIPSDAEGAYKAIDSDRVARGIDWGTYVYLNCRVATAHASPNLRSDPDGSEEFERLMNASQVMQLFAKYFIRHEYSFSHSYLTEEIESP
jgi:hypothetical protein